MYKGFWRSALRPLGVLSPLKLVTFRRYRCGGEICNNYVFVTPLLQAVSGVPPSNLALVIKCVARIYSNLLVYFLIFLTVIG
jgi:hypothetical protein